MDKSTSFIQEQKHLTKSSRFQTIQPSKIAEVLDGYGFDLVHLKTAIAKKPDRADFQTTIARYRSRDTFEIDGLSFDLIFKVPHLYGSLQGVLGLFRGICANQLNVGTHFSSVKVAHLGNPYDELNRIIPELVAQQQKLVETVKVMQSRDVTLQEAISLADGIARIRLENVNSKITKIDSTKLLIPRRSDDAASDLFSILNIIQENVIRRGVQYQFESTDQSGSPILKIQTARKLKEESVSAVELNAKIWDEASKLIIAA